MCKIEKFRSLMAPLPGEMWELYGFAFVNGERVAAIESPRGRAHVEGMKYRVCPDYVPGKRHYAKTFRTISEAKAYCEEIAAA